MLELKLRARIAITGATGYVGERLVEAALAQGFEVIALSRRPPADPRVSWVRFELAEPVVESLTKDVLAVIHLAAQTGASTVLSADAEVRAAECLIQAASRCGARFIFVSSQTARKDAPSPYGRTKAAIEDRVSTCGGIVVRPGQVYGGPARGLFGTLLRLTEQLPLLPRFFPTPLVQPIHVDDLAKGLMLAATSSAIDARTYCLGAAEPVSFTLFLATLARYRVRKNRVFLLVPQHVIRFLASVLGALVSQRLGLSQLLSLFELPLMESQADLQSLGLNLRPLEDGMARSGHGLRRRQILEAKTLLWYVLRQRPEASLMRRYVRMLESIDRTTILLVPRWMHQYPSLLAIADEPRFRRSSSGAAFDQRLDAATLIAEASTQGSARFLGTGRPAGLSWAVLLIVHAVTLEIASRIVGLLCKVTRSFAPIEEGR